MATNSQPQQIPTVASILGRALRRDPGGVTPEGARFILALGIHQDDRQRTLDLLVRRSEGRITEDEDLELLPYIEADRILTILKAQAALALKQAEASR